MSERTYYFAYGSNMAIERLKKRVSSAELLSTASLPEHRLKFHKPSKKDGSGKCDAAFTGNSEDRVLGALYLIQTSQLTELDIFEGRGNGYDRKTVLVCTSSNDSFSAETYIATKFDSSLRPLDWYKEHVLRGARAIELPSSYIASIEAVVADIDTDEKRRDSELAIYRLPSG
jgi:gamma-glutamylcyclotransferase